MRALSLLLFTVVTFSSFAAEKSVEPAESKAEAKALKVKAPYGFGEDLKKADPFIAAIVAKHEAEFPGALDHNYFMFPTSLNRLSYIQQGLFTELTSVEGFNEAWQNREPMTDITVEMAETVKSGEDVRLDSYAWDSFTFGLVRWLEGRLGDYKRTHGRLPTRKQFNEYLASDLLDYWKQSDGHPDRNFMATKAHAYYVIYATVARENEKLTPIKIVELIDEDLQTGTLDYLEDSISYLPLFEGWAQKTRRPEKFDERLKKTLMLAHDDINRFIYKRGDPLVLKAGDKITIREVHPDISIFRGFVGNDCATCFSPGFVFNPFDRYYYAFDGKGKRLGYVGLSIVTHKGEKTLLIHTIQGPDFTIQQAQMVIRGFQKAMASFGATRVMLARDSNIYSNVNFEPIRVAMMNAVKGQAELPIEWSDMQYREVIGKWDSEMTYDDPKRNPVGRETSFEDGQIKVEVAQRPFDFTMTATTPEMIAAAKEACTLRLTSRYSHYGDNDDWDY